MPEALGDEGILLLAPTGRDGILARSCLESARLSCRMASNLQQLTLFLADPCGAVLIAEEGLESGHLSHFIRTVSAQPAWSELPVVVITSGGELQGQRILELLAPHTNITLIERPLHSLTLISILKGAIRSRRRQYEVRDLLQKQAEATKQRDAFISMASHELKTPLTALRLQIHAYQMSQKRQRETRDGFDLPQLLGSVDRQINRLVRLVEDMLDVSRIDSKRLTLRRELTDLGELLGELVARFKPQFAAAGSRLDLIAPPGIIGLWDRSRLEQIVVNLFTNALRYAHGSPVDIRLTREGAVALLRVKDSGKGIAPEDHARIFERFGRVAGSDEGLGIGLYVSRQVALAHEGQLEVTSALGRGAEFTLTLPLGHSDPGGPSPITRA